MLPRLFKALLAGIFFCLLLFPGETPGQAQSAFNMPSVSGNSDLAVQSDGKILVASEGGLRRLYPDGRIDRTFATASEVARAVVLQPDGKILAGTRPTFTSAPRLRRLNPDGSVDPSLSCSLSGGDIWSVLPTSNDKIFIAGKFVQVNSVTTGNIARVNADGSVDPTFGNLAANDEVFSMVAVAGGKLVVGGSFTNIGGAARPAIARVNPNGTVDSSFSTIFGAGSIITAIAKQTDGKLVVVGSFTLSNGVQNQKNIARLNEDGTLDPTFVMTPSDLQQVKLNTVTIQPDGRILVGGALRQGAPSYAQSFPSQLVVRFNADGSVDNSFRYSNLYTAFNFQSSPIYRIVLDPNGRIWAGGTPFHLAGSNAGGMRLVRIDPNGKLEIPFSRFDYDGDGRTDLAVFRPSNHTWYVNTGQDYFSFQFGESTDVPVPADYDADGQADIAVFRESNATWYWINSSTFTFSYLQFGQPGDIPVQGHRNYDPRVIFDLFRPSNSTWYRYAFNLDANGTPVPSPYSIPFGASGDIPLPGHRGRKEFESRPAVFRPSTNTFYSRDSFSSSDGGAFTTIQLGQSGDIPLSGDFDGDFVTDAAIYRPSNGQWHIELSRDQRRISYTWGESGDIPVTADYDGDQRDDIAVFRPSNGTWYIIGSTEGWRIQQFGQQRDIPLPSSYLP